MNWIAIRNIYVSHYHFPFMVRFLVNSRVSSPIFDIHFDNVHSAIRVTVRDWTDQ